MLSWRSGVKNIDVKAGPFAVGVLNQEWSIEKMSLFSFRNGRSSKTAVVLTVLYLLVVAAALALLLLAGPNDSLAGIYFILVTFPWSSVLMWVTRTFHLDSMVFNSLFLLAGGLINGFVIYKVVSFLSAKLSDRR
jgi:hypothetical protein